MKKIMLFSVLSIFCLSISSCTMGKKDGKKKSPPPSHRRYHSELMINE